MAEMKRSAPHMFDQVADEITEWLQKESAWYVEAFKNGGRAPFAANVSEKQKLDYYQRRVFNDDGTPNEEGRSQVLSRVGTKGYAQIMGALGQRERPGSQPPEDVLEGDEQQPDDIMDAKYL